MKLRPVTSALYAAIFATACSSGGELADKRTPTGTQSIATSSDYSALYVANTDHGTIGRIPLAAGGAVTDVRVGERPTRIARAQGRVFVTLRGERKVAVLEEQGGALVEVGTVDVGAEPFGVVASADGARVYVSVSLANKVVELDGGSLAILREFTVENQPRWLALHPSGESLFVASAMGGHLTWIDLVGDRGAREVTFAVPSTFGADGTEVPLSRRLTGDLAISPNGELLLAPGLVVDNTTVIAEQDDGKSDEIPPSPGGYDAGRFNPVVVSVNLEDNGEPIVDTAQLIGVSTFTNVPIVGYPSSVAIDPKSELAIVTIEGAATAIALQIETTVSEPGVFDNALGAKSADAIAVPGGRGGFFGFSSRSHVAIGVPSGPRSVVFTDDDVPYVYGFLDRAVGELALAPVRERLTPSDTSNGEDVFVGAAPAPPFLDGTPQTATFEFSAQRTVQVADEVLSPLEVQGRRLFFAANDAKMAGVGSGVSCATCHFDGRNDGLTWSFSRGNRQTPSLAGKISLQAPVRWEGDRETVADDAMRTSQGLMGGRGLVHADAQAIEAFVDSTPDVDAPRLASEAAVQRGKAIFEDPAVACASCHNGPRFTDKKIYAMKGLERVQTRALVGLAATAPYYHDGSAKTLRELIDGATEAGMGNTSQLSAEQRADLEAYLLSL